MTRLGFDIAWVWTPGAYAAAVAATVALSMAAGLAASARVLAVPPPVVLRQGE